MSLRLGRNVRSFRRNESGAALVEFSLVMTFFLLLIFGIVEFSMLFFQWNSATKALQQGARLASVSTSVANRMSGNDSLYSGLSGGRIPGDPMPAFKTVCTATSNSVTCTCTGAGCPATLPSPSGSIDALKTIVFGTDFNPGQADPRCGRITDTSVTPARGGFPGMCDIFDRIRPENVVITYEQTGLGFVGRPGGPVPTITIELRNLTFGFIFLQALMRFAPRAIPAMKTTATGEDMNSAAPSP